jgi:hypothetical protein
VRISQRTNTKLREVARLIVAAAAGTEPASPAIVMALRDELGTRSR